MQASEIREMTESDVRARIDQLEEERFRLRFRGATENLEDPLRLRMIRKDVARLKTVLRERELTAAGPRAGRAKSAAARKSSAAHTRARKARTSAPQVARNVAPKARKKQER